MIAMNIILIRLLNISFRKENLTGDAWIYNVEEFVPLSAKMANINMQKHIKSNVRITPLTGHRPLNNMLLTVITLVPIANIYSNRINVTAVF